MRDSTVFRTWREFTQEEDRRCATFQLCIDELANDLYYEDRNKDNEEEEELNFD